MQKNHFVCTIDPKLADSFKKDLEDQGFSIEKLDYGFFNAKKKGISIGYYLSGKCVIQGKEIAPFIEFYLEPTLLKATPFTHPFTTEEMKAKIGSDEAGKGDYFGPLSVAACFVDESQYAMLFNLKIKDSKKLTDSAVLELSQKLRSLCQYESLLLYPEKYNALYEKFGNLNHLLAWAHTKVIENLYNKTGCKDVLIDQFASSASLMQSALAKTGLPLIVQQKHQAESDLAVAAASILARSHFLIGLEKLRDHYQIPFSKGSSSLVKTEARQFIQNFGKARLNEVAKCHFKITGEL